MKFLALIGLFAASAIADFSLSCTDINLDPATEVLSATCHNRAGDDVEAQYDLNGCFKYEDGKIQYDRPAGNFGSSCDDCTLFRQFHEFFGMEIVWINCTCEGNEVTYAIDSNIRNEDGNLSCQQTPWHD